MSSTNTVLGTIAAMHTFTENFPMNILDMRRGKVYTSIFDFLVDVLNACGLNIHQITDFLLEKIYGLEAGVQGNIEAFYEKIRNGEIDFNKQNEFTAELEQQLKTIILILLSGIFSCSAIPVLPNTVFDTPNENSFKGYANKALEALRAKEYEYKTLRVNRHAIDPLGLLDICPTSHEGSLYYASTGQDKYYHKEFVRKTEIVNELVTEVEETEVTVTRYEEVSAYTHQIGLYLTTTPNKGVYDEHENYVKLTEKAPKNISITIKYSPYGINSEYIWEDFIPKGETETTNMLLCSPEDLLGQKTIIREILINGNPNGGIELTGLNDKNEVEKTWVYLDKGSSSAFINVWAENNIDSLPWGSENRALTRVEKTETIPVSEDRTYTKQVEKEYFVYEYVERDASEVPVEEAIRVNVKPQGEVALDATDYVVYYDGLNPNTLYQTYDMNAFLWFALHKGMKVPQYEYNHLMWDSRVSARNAGITRNNSIEWNNWYNSKENYDDEFKWLNKPITRNSPLFPIIQIEPQGTARNFIFLRIPAQRYFLPNVREINIMNEETGGNIKAPFATNATLYKFNKDYLDNIQLLNPKLLLVGLCESLLGFSLSTLSSTRINLTRKLIESKLSKAIKSIIEANDMETEDCYMEFSNDEVNEMMEEMLLARYNATTYGGETATVKTHDTQKYIAMLDQVNPYTSVEGNMGMIKKIVTEVTADPMTEGSIEYGLQIQTDGNLLKKLLWAIVMPIVMSLFTPQLLLLLYINFTMMGLIRMDESMGQDFGMILNYLMNKIFSLLKSIIVYIKDKIVLLLLELFYEVILPLLIKQELLLLMERLEYWLRILKAALLSLPLLKFNFKKNKIFSAIEDVNYADIDNSQNTPESTATC